MAAAIAATSSPALLAAANATLGGRLASPPSLAPTLKLSNSPRAAAAARNNPPMVFSDVGPNKTEMPPMMRSLDTVLPTVEAVKDLEVVTRDFPDEKGRFEARHNVMLSKALMSGFVSSTSEAGTTTYEGTFLNHAHNENPMANGQGVRRLPDGSSYTGQWKDGFPHGNGEWQAPPPSCETYVGEWRRGKKHGFGVQRYANGDMYEGDWSHGSFQDRGKYIYANGDEFMGIFDHGNRKEGTMYFKDGRISTRKWEGATLVSCQDFDTRKRLYNPTITKDEVHHPDRNAYGAQGTLGMMSPRGIRMT